MNSSASPVEPKPSVKIPKPTSPDASLKCAPPVMKPSMGGFEFDPITHSYFKDGDRVPGVSEILKTVGLSKDYSGASDFYRQRGVAVHKAVEYFLAGTLDEASVDPLWAPYFDGFKRFWEKNQCSDVRSELPLYHPSLHYAGTLDLVLPGCGIFDLKCSKDPDPVAKLQGDGYQLLAEDYLGVRLPFYVVKLPGDGTFELIEYAGRNLWKPVLELYRWKRGLRGQRK